MWKYAHSSNKVNLSEHLLEYGLEASSLSYPILSRTPGELVLLAAVSASLITVSILVLLCTMTDHIGR